jgi:hypothetical protein
MSPPPPVDTEQTQAIIKDGLIASILGGLAMTSRLLLSQEPVTFGWVIRRVSAAAITAALVGYGIQDHISSPGLRMAVIGAAGYSAPECMDFLLQYVKKRGEAELSKVKGGSNAKAKPKRKKR